MIHLLGLEAVAIELGDTEQLAAIYCAMMAAKAEAFHASVRVHSFGWAK